MSIRETEGVLIGCRRFRETSLIVSFYARDLGRIKAVAKGARGPKRKFKSSLDLFVRGRLVAYVKESRDLQLLSDFEATRYYEGIQRDPRRFAYASAAGELLEALVAGEEPHEELFDLLVEFLDTLERSPLGAMAALFRAFQFKSCALLGYRPEVKRCSACGRDSNLVGFSPRAGGVVCAACAGESFGATRITGETLEALRFLGDCTLREAVEKFEDGSRVDGLVGPLLEAFMQYHVDRYRGIRSLQFLRKLPALGGAGAAKRAE